MKPVSLVQALTPKAIAIASVLAPRISKLSGHSEMNGDWNYFDNPWKGYKPEEGIEGHYTSSDLLTFIRPGHPHAKLLIGFLKMTNIKEQEKGKPIVLSEDVPEKYEDIYNFEEKVAYTETISHTFSKTTTFSQAAKQAWEVAAKVALSAEYAGIKGSFEASAKYGQELSSSSSESTTRSDTVSKTLSFEGPARFKLQAKRSSSKIRVWVKAICDFDFKLYFQVPDPKTGLGSFEWTSFQNDFIPAIKGISPEDQYSVPMFLKDPVSEKEVQDIVTPSDKVIEFPVDYDNPISQQLNVLKLDETGNVISKM